LLSAGSRPPAAALEPSRTLTSSSALTGAACAVATMPAAMLAKKDLQRKALEPGSLAYLMAAFPADCAK
jgi:hypothetical protein